MQKFEKKIKFANLKLGIKMYRNVKGKTKKYHYNFNS